MPQLILALRTRRSFLNRTDKPAGRIEDTVQAMTERFIKNSPPCGLCKINGIDMFDIIVNEKGTHIMNYVRGTVHLCKHCYRITILLDNLSWRIGKPIIKIIRRFQNANHR